MNYKDSYTLEQRLSESMRIKLKYPDRLPVICEKHKDNNKLLKIDRSKFLVPKDLTLGQFMFIIRKRLKLSQETALYFVIDGNIISTSSLIIILYEAHAEKDGFLYIKYTSENVFG